MRLEVVHVDDRLFAAYQLAQLALVKHPQPLRVDDIRKAGEEGSGLGRDLAVELVSAHQLDICDSAKMGKGQ